MFLPGGEKLAFVSSDSSYDLCIFSLSESRVVERTNFLGGVYYPSFSQDGTRLIFAYYENLGWDIASLKDPVAVLPSAGESLLTLTGDTTSYERNEPDPGRVKRYGFNLTPDYAYGAAGYSTGAGLSGQLNLALSDALGNHRFYLQADLLRDLINSDFYLEYWYLRRRLDFGAGFYQYFDYGYNWAGDSLYIRRNLALQGLAAYPFDRFTRLEFNPSFIYGGYDWYTMDPDGNLTTSGNTVWKPQVKLAGAFVFDNSFWGTMTAPERGTRARVELYAPVLGDQQFVTGYVDARNYLKIAKRYIWANRLIGLASFGANPERYYLGGEDVRGYQYYEFIDQPGTKALVLSSELRYPFIDRLKLAFPLPLDITDIRGVAFADAGMVWDKQLPWVWDATHSRLQDLKVGVGAGARLQISWFALKLDFGYPLSALSLADSTSERKREGTWYFGIGTDF
jgi:outer membrane protein assembly factor BamA